jgi:Na+-translocating ferredoxin:NAD+ oxidoreductase RnfG subunit
LDDGSALFVAKAGDEVIGYIGKAAAKGYSGEIEVITGISADGIITGINVGGANFSETPGLGAKAKDTAFAAQFAGKKSPVQRGNPKNDNAVDGITAATITTNAVLGCVNSVARQVKAYLNPDADKPAQIAEGTSYAGEAVGFAGVNNPVYVEVNVNDSGVITALKIGDERFAESDNYGVAALDPEFARQFVGKSMPIAMEDIDAIAGSTFTTQAVLDAMNSAYANKNIVKESAPIPAPTTAAVEEATAQPEPVVVPENALYGSSRGYVGPVAVTAAFDEDGRISFILIGDEQFAETDGFGTRALDPAFGKQFIGKLPPLAIADENHPADECHIDGLTGATVTTKAVLETLNSLHAQAFPQEVPEQPAVDETPSTVSGDEIVVTKQGFMGPVTVRVSFTSDGKIAKVVIDSQGFMETPGYGALALEEAYLSQFVDKQPPLSLYPEEGSELVENIRHIDTATSATSTAQAIVDAINEAFESRR